MNDSMFSILISDSVSDIVEAVGLDRKVWGQKIYDMLKQRFETARQNTVESPAMQSIEYRYNNDPMVKALVDSLVSAIINLQLTPSEIRKCAMLTAIRYEQSRPTPVRLDGVSEQHLTQAKAAEALPEGEICPVCKGCRILKKPTPLGFWTETCSKCNGTGKLPLALARWLQFKKFLEVVNNAP